LQTDPADEYWPAAHEEQELDVAATVRSWSKFAAAEIALLEEPAGQLVHAPSPLPYLPGEHIVREL